MVKIQKEARKKFKKKKERNSGKKNEEEKGRRKIIFNTTNKKLKQKLWKEKINKRKHEGEWIIKERKKERMKARKNKF